MSHARHYLDEAITILQRLDSASIDKLATALADLRERGGRLFLLGVGGSAANCSHAVNDFRKLCGIEAYTPVDNVSELTARTNDEGWDTVFSEWLKVSRANAKDAILVFSVGGGDAERNVSPNIVSALKEAKTRGLKIFGVVGRDGGYTRKVGDVVIGLLLWLHRRGGLSSRRGARYVLLAYLLLTLAYPGVKFVTDVLIG